MDLTSFKLETQIINYNNIFLLSDIHLGVRANSLEWIHNIKQFFREFYIPYLKENMHEGDIVFFLGDFFDNRQLLDISVLNTGIDIVLELSSILPVHFLTGNHDIYKKYDTDVNSIIAFKYIPNVYIYEKPVILSNGNSRILVLPWIGNKDIEDSYAKMNTYDYIFAHADINGFKYDNGRDIKTSGANFIKNKNIKRLFSGHIHKRQEQNKFIYIGSPYHTKRSDIGNEKGVYIFNPDKNTFSFLPNNYSPLFQRVKLDSILEFTLNDTIKLFDNNYTDIIVPDKYIHLFNLTKFIDILKDCKYKKIEVVGERKKIDEEISDIAEGIDIKDILSLLEISISDLGHQMEIFVKLKVLNKQYYEKAAKESIE